tara:strand:- start:3024 stop:4046 length:1023 start_codon:yes stop_codon:yes gene_type:complete
MLNNYITTLVTTKIFFASLTLYFFAIYLELDMFAYPDFYNIHNKCSDPTQVFNAREVIEQQSNILYSKFFCGLSSITGKEITYKSNFFIVMAASINMLMLVGYFKILEKFLNEYGKYLLIALFVMHPYMNIYFFRFYSEIFASLGIFLIFFFAINKININLFFVLTALILMNFRIALVPVFLIYGLWEMYSQYIKKNYKALFFSILLIFISLMSYLPVMEISTVFITMNSDINLIEKILTNIVLAFGFRESIGISRDIFIFNEAIDFLSFGTSVIFIIIHSIGLYGIIKLSFKQNISILLVFTYLLAPILALAHMRYLLPLMPILLFGFTYVFFRKKRGG